jgi:hypothetical protein
MQIAVASQSSPGRLNEDYACAGPDWAVMLDGATPAAGVDSGCVHGVPWLVRRLAGAICSRLVLEDGQALPDVLAAAISETRAAHDAGCDLANPDSPSSTVSIVRVRDGRLDYLALADSPIVLRHRDETFTVVEDGRISHLPGGRPYSVELVRASRNRPGGFWVASTSADAAYQAVTGTSPVAGIADVGLFTDGVTRLVDWYGHSWPGLFSHLRAEGPRALIAMVREEELRSPRPAGKVHDDATAVYLQA